MSIGRIEKLINEYESLGISQQLNYDQLYLYSIITHSTAIEGSTISDIENQLLLEKGISPGKPIQEELMNLDLKRAYERAFEMADNHTSLSMESLSELSGDVMRNTGSLYETIAGRFDSSKGDLRLLNVSAGRGGRSYLAWQKVPARLEKFCKWVNSNRTELTTMSIEKKYMFSFEVHYRLVDIHPWADGNGRMSRLVMNMIQREANTLPSIVNKDKRVEYIKSLAEAQTTGDITPFVSFMMRNHEQNIEQQILEFKKSIQGDSTTQLKAREIDYIGVENTNQTGVIKRGYTGVTRVQEEEHIKAYNYRLSEKEEIVLREITDNPYVTIESIVENNEFSRPTATRAIKRLKEAGIIERAGSKKTGHWKVQRLPKTNK